MRVKICLDGRCLRRFHVELARRLARTCEVRVALATPGGPALPQALEAFFSCETLLYGLPERRLAPRVEPGELALYQGEADGPVDLVLDLCGLANEPATPVWRLTFGGGTGDAALLGALAQGQAPLAALTRNGRVIAAGRLGTESRNVLLAAFEDALARTLTLVAAAINGSATGADLAAQARAPEITNVDLASFGVRNFAGAIARRLQRLRHSSPHWRVGWRKIAGPDLIDLRAHPATGWTDLADDSRRFYADPFPILRQGQVTLFVEEYIHKIGKGVISAVAFGPDGPLGAPEPVLETPVHLSYPFVFERDGETWMIPESCAAGSIDLYRATRFPGGWVKEASLVCGVVAGDATLLEHDGRWWMLACVQDDGGSYSDALYIWSAPDFRGPWTAHRHNPVLIDIASARPAGRIVLREGVLWRPVQDCRGGYGHSLGLARILQLDDQGFRQNVETLLTAGPLWRGNCLHTLNSAGGFEFIDGEGSARLSR